DPPAFPTRRSSDLGGSGNVWRARWTRICGRRRRSPGMRKAPPDSPGGAFSVWRLVSTPVERFVDLLREVLERFPGAVDLASEFGHVPQGIDDVVDFDWAEPFAE